MWDLRLCPSAQVEELKVRAAALQKSSVRSFSWFSCRGALRNLRFLVWGTCIYWFEELTFTGLLPRLTWADACWMLKELSCKSAFPIHRPSPNILIDLSSSPHCLMVFWGSSLRWGACMWACVCVSCFQEWLLACFCFIFSLNHPEFMGSKSARCSKKFS